MQPFSRVYLVTLAFLAHVAAQQYGIADLPTCAKTCASTAATAAGCTLDDEKCLCSKPAFSTATLNCAMGSCDIHDSSVAAGVLGLMCASLPTTTATSRTSSSSNSSTILRTTTSANSTSASVTTTTSQSSTTSTSITSLGTVNTASTSVVIQTVVVVPQPTDTSPDPTVPGSGSGAIQLGPAQAKFLGAACFVLLLLS